MDLQEEMVKMLLELSNSMDIFSSISPPLGETQLDSPFPAPKGTGPSLRYKTELCNRYAETGFCAYRNRCQFAHGLSDLRPPFQHPKYKTELCRSFHILGTCTYGPRCLFIHGHSEKREVPDTISLRQRRPLPFYSKKQCRLWRSPAGCPYGSNCLFQHPHAVRDICRHYAALGVCPYGVHCLFKHTPPPDRWGTGSNAGSGSLSPSESDAETGNDLFTAASANNAFNFSSLLLPLALKLEILGEDDISVNGRNVTDNENSQEMQSF
ncbi:mRNA decay activator protein ZFP36L2-like [Bufo bufo]|uniref:mRNA decay activator protein ZFP36L2-like n=1 Tax=Bufo bufo TaxID=8384 RepID=UPI001ABDF1A9|nr:mRNA decay activator protein ZFP36L2-like [Bufo bufo]